VIEIIRAQAKAEATRFFSSLHVHIVDIYRLLTCLSAACSPLPIPNQKRCHPCFSPSRVPHFFAGWPLKAGRGKRGVKRRYLGSCPSRNGKGGTSI